MLDTTLDANAQFSSAQIALCTRLYTLLEDNIVVWGTFSITNPTQQKLKLVNSLHAFLLMFSISSTEGEVKDNQGNFELN